MATFTKVQNKSGTAWKAAIRQKGLKPIHKTFTRKSHARAWAKRIEGDNEQCRALGNRKASGVTLSNLIDNYVNQYNGKCPDRLRILHYWKQRIGHVKITDADADLIMDERDRVVIPASAYRVVKRNTALDVRSRIANVTPYWTPANNLNGTGCIWPFSWRWRLAHVKANCCRGMEQPKL